MNPPARGTEDLLRQLAPQVLGALVRRHGQFDACEDAVQEALLAAARQWPAEGVPDQPRAWLLTVAGRALVDQWRADSARRRREQAVAALDPASREPAAEPPATDDTLVLLFLCCHPALSPPAQLALMLLTDARRPARTDPDGSIVPLAEQDRQRWDTGMIAEGQALLAGTLGTAPIGPYQVQAAIAAVHDEAPTAEQTDWPQILALYGVLTHVAPGPMVTLSRAVAVAMVHGPAAGLALLGTLDADEQLTHSHRRYAVRAHLLELAGHPAAARQAYLQAARMTASLPEQRYLRLRAARLPAREPVSRPGAGRGLRA